MKSIDKCPATKSGKALVGAYTVDCLSVFSTTSYKTIEELAPYVAMAYAEAFGGYLKHIEQKEPKGFYYTDKEDVAGYIRFDGIDYKSWVLNPPKGITINVNTSSRSDKGTESEEYISIVVIDTGSETYKSSFTANNEREAELVALLIGCVLFRRGNPNLYNQLLQKSSSGKEKNFDEALSSLLPIKRTKIKNSFFGTIRKLFKTKGETYSNESKTHGRGRV